MAADESAGTILKILNGVQSGVDVVLVDGTYTFGSGDDDDIQIFDVSLRPGHARLRTGRGKIELAGGSGSLRTRNGATLEAGGEFQEIEQLDVVSAGTTRFALGARTANWASITDEDRDAGLPSREPLLPAKAAVVAVPWWRNWHSALPAAAVVLLALGGLTVTPFLDDGRQDAAQAVSGSELDSVRGAVAAFDFGRPLKIDQEVDGAIFVTGFVDSPVQRRAIVGAIKELNIPVRVRIAVRDVIRDDVASLIEAGGYKVSYDLSEDGTLTLSGVILDPKEADDLVGLMRDRVIGLTGIKSQIKTSPTLLGEARKLAQRSQIEPLVLLRLDGDALLEASGVIPTEKIDAWVGFLQAYSNQFADIIPLRSLVRLQNPDGSIGEPGAVPGSPLYLGNGAGVSKDDVVDVDRLRSGKFALSDIFVNKKPPEPQPSRASVRAQNRPDGGNGNGGGAGGDGQDRGGSAGGIDLAGFLTGLGGGTTTEAVEGRDAGASMDIAGFLNAGSPKAAAAGAKGAAQADARGASAVDAEVSSAVDAEGSSRVDAGGAAAVNAEDASGVDAAGASRVDATSASRVDADGAEVADADAGAASVGAGGAGRAGAGGAAAIDAAKAGELGAGPASGGVEAEAAGAVAPGASASAGLQSSDERDAAAQRGGTAIQAGGADAVKAGAKVRMVGDAGMWTPSVEESDVAGAAAGVVPVSGIGGVEGDSVAAEAAKRGGLWSPADGGNSARLNPVGAADAAGSAPERLAAMARELLGRWSDKSLGESEAGRRLAEGMAALDKRRDIASGSSPSALADRYAVLLARGRTDATAGNACWAGSRLTKQTVGDALFWLDLFSVSESVSMRDLGADLQNVVLEAALNPRQTTACAIAATGHTTDSVYLYEISRNRGFVNFITRDLDAFPLDVAGVNLSGQRFVQTRKGLKMSVGYAPDETSRVALVGELGVVVERSDGYSTSIFGPELNWVTQ